jgi:hypothetical protein
MAAASQGGFAQGLIVRSLPLGMADRGLIRDNRENVCKDP